MQTLVLTICCGLSLAEVKKSPDVSSAPTCKAGDADSCEASSEIDSPDDVAILLQTQVRIKEHGGEQTHEVEKALSYESSQARSPHASALVKSKLVKSKLDIFQKVYIEDNLVADKTTLTKSILGDGAGQGALNTCIEFEDYIVSNPTMPHVKVCGTGIKMTVYLLGRCGEGSLTAASMPKWEVGSCDTSQIPTTCESYSVSDDTIWTQMFGATQSYKITQC
jgi:hypothetical protein